MFRFFDSFDRKPRSPSKKEYRVKEITPDDVVVPLRTDEEGYRTLAKRLVDGSYTPEELARIARAEPVVRDPFATGALDFVPDIRLSPEDLDLALRYEDAIRKTAEGLCRQARSELHKFRRGASS